MLGANEIVFLYRADRSAIEATEWLWKFEEFTRILNVALDESYRTSCLIKMTTLDDRRPYIRVSLLIRGGEDPDEITRILNVAPDESYRKGAPIPLPPEAKYKVKKTRVYSTSIWKLNARLKQHSYDVEAYVKNLLHRVQRVNDKLAQLDRRRFNVSIDVSLDLLLDASTAATGLSKETMHTLARLGASFDVDTYVWRELPQYAIEGLRHFKS